MEAGYLAIVLHAHLPYVRHPEHDYALEENWFYEAITESYLPLIQMMEGLMEDGVDFRLTMSITPPLASMLSDPLLTARYVDRLDNLIALGEKEIRRTRSKPALSALAHRYRRRCVRARETFVDRCDRNLVGAFKRLQDAGKLEILACAATHGYLPLLSVDRPAVRAQVSIGTECYRNLFGRNPAGFWLPECGYCPEVEDLLLKEGIRYTILETHGVTRAEPRPEHGVYAPIYSPSGLAAFGRDPECSRQVWSAFEGYPGDEDYREFYRDIGHDLGLAYIGPHIHPDGIRTDTGYKYFRVTGKGVQKEVYVPEKAMKKAELHARDFLFHRREEANAAEAQMDRPPIMTAPYDAELFGHWWFEGPVWLDFLIRKTAREESLRLVAPSDYLEAHPVGQVSTPCTSSWGRKGFHETWLNARNAWIYPRLHRGAVVLKRLATTHPRAEGLRLKALQQAARELLLAQSSDWAFMMDQGDTAAYAVQRTLTHLERLDQIAQAVEGGSIDAAWLSQVSSRDNIFPDVDYRLFA